SSLVVPVFQKGDDPIDAINHMMSFLTAVVTSRYPTTNNQLRTSSNPRQQATIYDGKVIVQPVQGRQTTYAAGTTRKYTPGASGSNTGKQRTVICYNCKGEGHIAKQCTKPKRKRDDTWFNDKVLLVQAQASGQALTEEEIAFLAMMLLTRAIIQQEQMLLAAKDEAGVNLDAKENDFMLMNAYGDDQLEELNASVIMMACIQPTDDTSDAEPSYDVELISQVNYSQINMINGLLSKSGHEHKNHEKLKTVINTSVDDQIDFNIIFDDPYMDNNSRQAEHDPNAHDQLYADIESLIYNVQAKAENQRKINIELEKKKELLKKELETCKERYLDDIVTLKEKIKSHERVVFKMSHSLQTIHMLGTTPNSFYDPNMKDGLGYKNPECLKKAIEAQPKMYNRKNLKYHKLKVNLPDSEETLEDAKKVN
ncbi:retrovirus-related pol polyprotein from transposon TNT 1-94, partial [Tanacetum coccineum]